MIRFETPEALLGLALIPVAALVMARQRGRGPLRISSLELASPLSGGPRARVAWIPGGLRLLALALLVVAAARPQHGAGSTLTRVKGVAIMGVIDRSSSMSHPMQYAGAQTDRLGVVKSVFAEFVTGEAPAGGGGAKLPGRPQDMIGLITFAAFPEIVAPLTRIHDPVVDLVGRVRLVPERSAENQTAIGDALALAAARLRVAEETLRDAQADAAADESLQTVDFEIKSKVIVLLTDGRENHGEMTAADAAQLCADLGVKVYVVGIGGYRLVRVPFSDEPRRLRSQDFNEPALRMIAERTGGRYWAADDADALRGIYAEIDELEKTEIESIDYTVYDERYAAPAMAAGGLLLLELLLGLTVFRRLP